MLKKSERQYAERLVFEKERAYIREEGIKKFFILYTLPQVKWKTPVLFLIRLFYYAPLYTALF